MLGYGFGTTGSSSIYGQQRPSFNESGAGMPYSTMLGMIGPSIVNQDVSYDTSSKDPVMVRCRVFIGNLIRGDNISREDIIELCRPFGKLLAVTFFKGYAFVQFGEDRAADDACTHLDGKYWKGVHLDVHLAMAGPGGKKKIDESFSRKRRYDDFSRDETFHIPPPPQPPVTECNPLDETADQNRRNREVAMGDKTTNDDLADNGGMVDTLICGSCRFVTCDYEVFKDHRIGRCKTAKVDGEPKSLLCTSCHMRFSSAWSLICHLTEFHRMQLYRDDVRSDAGNDSPDPVPAKRAPSPAPFFSPLNTEKSLPVTEAEIAAPSAMAPIGKQTVPVAKLTTEAVVEGGAVANPPSPVEAAVAPVAPSAQWNPMTGQTIVGLGSLQKPESESPTPSLGLLIAE